MLLRRQLASETPRARPWIRTKRAGRLPAVWRRDCHQLPPLPRRPHRPPDRPRCRRRPRRRVRLAGRRAGGVFGAALALYLAGYEAVEPIAQETDHPTRWDGNGGEFGMALLRHLPAAVTLMVLVCGIAGATALLLVPATVVTHLLPIVILPAAGAAALGAALSTVQGSNTVNSIVDTGEMAKMDLDRGRARPERRRLHAGVPVGLPSRGFGRHRPRPAACRRARPGEPQHPAGQQPHHLVAAAPGGRGRLDPHPPAGPDLTRGDPNVTTDPASPRSSRA